MLSLRRSEHRVHGIFSKTGSGFITEDEHLPLAVGDFTLCWSCAVSIATCGHHHVLLGRVTALSDILLVSWGGFVCKCFSLLAAPINTACNLPIRTILDKRDDLEGRRAPLCTATNTGNPSETQCASVRRCATLSEGQWFPDKQSRTAGGNGD